MTAPVLRFSYDDRTDRLVCLEHGRVDDGLHPDAIDEVGEDFAYVLDEPDGRPVGFMVNDFVLFEADAMTELWEGRRFDCPALGLRDASAGAICSAASVYVDGSTIDRVLFWTAVGENDEEEAVEHWRSVIEAGDLKGHFGIGYTLFELGRFTEAYMHLRTYTDVAPYSAWGWNWRGQAALAVGDMDEARTCFSYTLEVEEIEHIDTDAEERLEALESSLEDRSPDPGPADHVEALGHPFFLWSVNSAEPRGACVDWPGWPLVLTFDPDGITVHAEVGRAGDWTDDDGELTDYLDVPLGPVELDYEEADERAWLRKPAGKDLARTCLRLAALAPEVSRSLASMHWFETDHITYDGLEQEGPWVR